MTNSLIARTRLDGRTAIVTGGAGHIGAAIARGFDELGATTIVVDSDEGRARKVAESLRNGAFRALDITDTAALRELPGLIAAEFGGVDILVNAAALVGTSALKGWAVPFEEQAVDAWRQALEVNLTAPFVLTQAAAPFLGRTKRGTVVNIGSIYGVVGPDWRLYDDTDLANPAAYGASKGGLIQLTRWLATTLAPNVRVNVVSPGGIMRGHVDPFLERYVSRTPMRRMGTEDDLVGAVVYFASDLSAYTTGQSLVVDGGFTAW